MSGTSQALSSAERSRRYREKNVERLRAEGRDRHERSADAWNQRKRDSRAENPEQVRARDRELSRKHYASQSPEARQQRNKKNWALNRDRLNVSRRDKRYGLNTGEYDRMLAAQEGICAICAILPDEAGGSALVVDHCHATGKVRGLLCRQCNLNLSFVEKRGHLYERMAGYLTESTVGRDADDQLRAAQAVIQADRTAGPQKTDVGGW